jgi:hypothetical protein
MALSSFDQQDQEADEAPERRIGVSMHSHSSSRLFEREASWRR